MAIVQMHDYSNIEAEVKVLKEQLDQLTAKLKNKENELAEVYQERETVLSKLEELSNKVSKLKKDDKWYLEKLLKQTNKPLDEAYKLKVLSTLNTIEFSTSRLRNYNDSRAMMKLELLDQKLGSMISGNRVGLLCTFSVVLGAIVGALLVKFM